MRRSLSTMHRSRSVNPAAAMHRAVDRARASSVASDSRPADNSKASVEDTGVAGSSRTPGRARPSGGVAFTVPTPGRARPSVSATPSALTLQQRLEQWLARRGKQLSSFRHLHCFGREVADSLQTPAAAGTAALARRASSVRRVQLDPGSPPLREQPTPRAAKTTQTTPLSAGTPRKRAAGAAAPTPTDSEQRVDNVLSDLTELQELGLPSDQIISWLDRLSRDPVSAGRARFWLCRASVAEKDGKVDEVLDCFKQASRAHAEPVAELISGLEQFVRRAAGPEPEPEPDAENAPPPAAAASPARRRPETRTPRRPLLDRSNVFDSTVIKYALVDDEPVLKKLAALRMGDEANILSVITPVRRSTRRKSMKPPTDAHMALFDSVEAISETLRRSALFRRNSALVSP